MEKAVYVGQLTRGGRKERVFLRGKPIFGGPSNDQVVGCSLHRGDTIICHKVADGDAEVDWCQPLDGSNPHIVIGRAAYGAMRPTELREYVWAKPKRRRVLPSLARK